MKSNPLIFAITLAAIALPLALSQAKPSPQLSTSDRVAIQTLETQKQEAQQKYQQAAQTELSIEQEFAATHPGWHLNQQTFLPEQNAPAPAAPTPKKK